MASQTRGRFLPISLLTCSRNCAPLSNEELRNDVEREHSKASLSTKNLDAQAAERLTCHQHKIQVSKCLRMRSSIMVCLGLLTIFASNDVRDVFDVIYDDLQRMLALHSE